MLLILMFFLYKNQILIQIMFSFLSLNYNNSIKSSPTKIYTLTEISVQGRIKEILNNMEEVNEIKSS